MEALNEKRKGADDAFDVVCEAATSLVWGAEGAFQSVSIGGRRITSCASSWADILEAPGFVQARSAKQKKEENFRGVWIEIHSHGKRAHTSSSPFFPEPWITCPVRLNSSKLKPNWLV